MALNRKLLLQVTAPGVVIGMLLFAACLVSAWQVNRLQTNMASILTENVTSLEAAQEVEISLLHLRLAYFLYVMSPTEARLLTIERAHHDFEETIHRARGSVHLLDEERYVEAIEAGYVKVQEELNRLRDAAHDRASLDFGRLAETDPTRHVASWCDRLLDINKAVIEQTAQENSRISHNLRLVMLLLGLGGPISGLIMGYGIARGLSRSIYQLSVRVQDMAQRLDQDVATVSVAGDADIARLDQQLQHVVHRVREVADRLQEQQREMIRAQQLAAVGQLGASVAHEVRNPLTSIKMLIEASLRERNPKPFTRQNMEVIHSEILRLERTVQSFLDFARPPTLQRSVCDLRDVVHQAAQLVQARSRQQRVALDVRTPNKPIAANVDRGQLCTVLVNLLINALDALPSGGEIAVALEPIPEGGARLIVSDTGAGVHPEIRDQLFTPFVSTKPTGSGLGLSISKHVVEEHGGAIASHNRPEGGACFVITLPGMSREEPHAAAAAHR